MKIESRVEGGTLVVVPGVSRLDASVAVPFKEGMAQLLADNPRRVVIDVGKVSFVDSSGLGAMVALLKRIGPTGALVLADVQPAVAKLLALTRLDRVFEIRKSVAEAVA
ncbi:MAG: STAS domain-containing protein [Bauldia sp.]